MSVRNIPVKLNITGITPATAYTCPPNTVAIITAAVAVNTDITSRLLTGNIIPNAGSATSDNRIIESFPLDRLTDTFIDNLHGQVLSSGDFLSFNLEDVGTVNINLTIQEQV